MSDLLPPSLAGDQRSEVFDHLTQGIEQLDTAAVLVNLIDLVPASALPYLAEQFNVVGPIWQYLQDDTERRRAIKGSARWHRVKGTPYAVEQALSWLGWQATVEDTTSSASRWAEYQIQLDKPVTPAQLPTILELARYAAPTRAHLVRLYGSLDIRPAVTDVSRWDGALLDNDSGVLIDGVVVSFAERHAAVLPAPQRGVVGGAAQNRAVTLRRDAMYWDSWALDSVWMVDVSGGIGHVRSAICPDRALSAPAGSAGELRQAVLERDLAAPIPSAQQALSAISPERYPHRKWRGPWAGPWRLAIPFNHYTTED